MDIFVALRRTAMIFWLETLDILTRLMVTQPDWTHVTSLTLRQTKKILTLIVLVPTNPKPKIFSDTYLFSSICCCTSSRVLGINPEEVFNDETFCRLGFWFGFGSRTQNRCLDWLGKPANVVVTSCPDPKFSACLFDQPCNKNIFSPNKIKIKHFYCLFKVLFSTQMLEPIRWLLWLLRKCGFQELSF